MLRSSLAPRRRRRLLAALPAHTNANIRLVTRHIASACIRFSLEQALHAHTQRFLPPSMTFAFTTTGAPPAFNRQSLARPVVCLRTCTSTIARTTTCLSDSPCPAVTFYSRTEPTVFPRSHPQIVSALRRRSLEAPFSHHQDDHAKLPPRSPRLPRVVFNHWHHPHLLSPLHCDFPASFSIARGRNHFSNIRTVTARASGARSAL